MACRRPQGFIEKFRRNNTSTNKHIWTFFIPGRSCPPPQIFRECPVPSNHCLIFGKTSTSPKWLLLHLWFFYSNKKLLRTVRRKYIFRQTLGMNCRDPSLSFFATKHTKKATYIVVSSNRLGSLSSVPAFFAMHTALNKFRIMRYHLSGFEK